MSATPSVTAAGPRASSPSHATLSSTPPDDQTSLDTDSRAWLEALRADGPDRVHAIARLHALLLRAARFELARRTVALAHLRGGDLDSIALQSADDALLAVLRKLDDFRGQSRFTTWAYKFALLEAAVKLRRLAWQGREIPLEPERWPLLGDCRPSPQSSAEQSELLAAVEHAINAELTPHQREVLVAVALNEVPIDVLAARLNTTRGALYKTLHDARRRLRQVLEADGHSIQPPSEGAR